MTVDPVTGAVDWDGPESDDPSALDKAGAIGLGLTLGTVVGIVRWLPLIVAGGIAFYVFRRMR